MSAATTPATATNGIPVSPVEYVRSLSGEDKQAVFLALLREVISMCGNTGRILIDDEDGKPFGYYVPPKAGEADELLPDPTHEQAAELDRRARAKGIPATEVIADLKARLAALQQPSPESSVRSAS
jgi:hypothetical protein